MPDTKGYHPFHQIRQCLRPTCRFRFPVSQGQPAQTQCPKCGSATALKEIDSLLQPPAPASPPPGIPVEVLLDNIRSAFNVGAIFRTADGAGVQHIHLCGITPAPGHPRISKTALGAEQAVSWTQHWNSQEVIEQCRSRKLQIWALEGGPDSLSLFDCLPFIGSSPMLLVIGNEISGVDPDILAECDRIVYIPMLGVKRSLNVSIAFAVAIYTIRFHPQHQLFNPPFLSDD